MRGWNYTGVRKEQTMRLIDADYVLSKIGEYADHPNEELVNNLAIAFDIVCEAPTVSLKNKWISINDSLPINMFPVIVSANKIELPITVIDIAYYKWGQGWIYNGQPIENFGYKVAAWMPLPEPWKGADNE